MLITDIHTRTHLATNYKKYLHGSKHVYVNESNNVCIYILIETLLGLSHILHSSLLNCNCLIEIKTTSKYYSDKLQEQGSKEGYWCSKRNYILCFLTQKLHL